MMTLTNEELTIALFIRSGSNSVRDLMADIDRGTATVRYHLDHLKEKGVACWNPEKSRTLQLTPLGNAMLRPYCLIPNGRGVKIGRVDLIDLAGDEAPGEGMAMTRFSYGMGK